jgi:hypothetical protein
LSSPRYLAEFEYRFNRCFDLGSMIERFSYVDLRTSATPNRRFGWLRFMNNQKNKKQQ